MRKNKMALFFILNFLILSCSQDKESKRFSKEIKEYNGIDKLKNDIVGKWKFSTMQISEKDKNTLDINHVIVKNRYVGTPSLEIELANNGKFIIEKDTVGTWKVLDPLNILIQGHPQETYKIPLFLNNSYKIIKDKRAITISTNLQNNMGKYIEVKYLLVKSEFWKNQ